MSVDVLRRAAALMRERAERGSSWPPMRWFNVGGAVYGGTAAPHQVVVPITTYYDDAEHIASWHPVVALAVADWLDDEALMTESGRVVAEAALTVARAYLGEVAS